MKRIISLALACMLVLGCVFALASCEKFVESLRGIADGSANGPNSDYEKAAEALEDADYEVQVIDDDEYLDYVGVDGLVAFVYASNDDEDMISIYYFDDEDDMLDAYEDLKDDFDEAKEQAEEEGEDFDYVIGKSGKMIWLGTEAAIKAAK